ncbi:roadblock/LC7 domain-containing protein [Pelobacter seleniigenes]|uniref:roadblock/LC7 domain-containing protein n=1 Tax=Pelobacter seleniigenes TaxID=407188 RepID=UPI0004A76B7F|nr:GTPase [Pelobacter seleniigenes]
MFKAILKDIVTGCSGGVGAILMGFDGISIDQYLGEDNSVDLNLVGIEYSNIAKEVRRAAEILNVGTLSEVSIKTERFYIIIQVVTDEYFVGLIVDRSGNYGQGRYLLMREVPRLRIDLE